MKDIVGRIKSLASKGEDVHIEYKSCIDKVSGSVYEIQTGDRNDFHRNNPLNDL